MKSLAIAAALLAVPSLFASADLKMSVDAPETVIRAGFTYTGLFFDVRNDGPDTATSVKLDIRSTIPVICPVCDDIGPIPPGQERGRFIEIHAPTTPVTFTVTATATSVVPDPNPADNTASQTMTVSAGPDLELRLGGPQAQDLALPFNLFISLTNRSITAAHDVEVNVDFSPEVGIRTLPSGCSSSAPGRVVCRIDSVAPTGTSSFAQFQLTLVAPTGRDGGSLVFAARATESEPDFDPTSNNFTLTVPLYQTIYVTSTANDGSGSLRQAIAGVNGGGVCGTHPFCAIAFRIEEPSANPWKTIRITSPLPRIMTHVRIDGATQSGFFGDTNPDGPEIEVSGGGTVDGDGFVVAGCGIEIANLAVNGFRGNGISVINALNASQCNQTFAGSLHHLFVGTDPTGTAARPNGRGIGTSVDGFGMLTFIGDSVISGNTHSGIFGLSGRLGVVRNRIGVKAHADEPLPNGNTGIYVGSGGFGSDIGASGFQVGVGAPDTNGNVIAFNGQMGVAVAADADNVSIRNNRIWGNGGLAIDVGLDGPTPNGPVPVPILTLAHYDPVAKQTVIEGDVATPTGFFTGMHVDFFASDAPALSGAGEAQRPLGVVGTHPGHFRFTVNADLTGQFVSATATRDDFEGFAALGANGIDQGFLTRTSEVSRPIEVR